MAKKQASRTGAKPVSVRRAPARAESDSRSSAVSTQELMAVQAALADPTRFSIFQNIAAGRCNTCTSLLEAVSISSGTLSHHLRVLERAGLIRTERVGKTVKGTVDRAVWRRYLAALRASVPLR